MSEPSRRRLSRRNFLELAGAAGVAAGTFGAATMPANAETSSLTSAECQLILQIARAGAVFPVPFGDFGEAGPAVDRATMPRLLAAVTRLTADRLVSAKAGADGLLAAQLPGAPQPALLAELGRLVSVDDAAYRPQLLAATALAIVTVSTHFDPNADNAADVWLGGLGILYQRGQLPGLAQNRGKR
jgi:hypothetical protein